MKVIVHCGRYNNIWYKCKNYQDVFFFCQDCDTLQPHTLVTEHGNRTEANKNEFTS